MDFDDDRDLIQEIKKELKCVQITFHCNLPVKFPEKETNLRQNLLELWKIIENYQT